MLNNDNLPTFKKFSQHFKNCLKNSLIIAKNFGHKKAHPAHLLLALTQERGSIGGEFLIDLKLNQQQLSDLIETGYAVELTDYPSETEFSETTKKIIEKAAKAAYKNKHQYIGTEHLLLALLESNDLRVEKIIADHRLSPQELGKQAGLIVKTSSKFPEIVSNFANPEDLSDDYGYSGKNSSNILDYFGRNLTDTEIQKNIDPVIGRNQEINRIIEILCRRTKNNPLLLGDPGVGKTAIIEGLAKKITQKEVPDFLLDKKIYSLDLAAVVAGTSFRGEFEARIREIIAEIEENNNIILFIDEIHQIVGAGSSTGSLDAGNILKPALARGEIKIIGATTYSDYRKSIESDPALARRFQTIKIAEPGSAEAQQILLGIKKYFENFHQISIEDEAIIAAVELSRKFLPDKFLPDKAIDLIDEAAASLKVHRQPSKTELKIKEILRQLEQTSQSLEQLIIEEKFNEALNAKSQIHQLKTAAAKLKKRLNGNNGKMPSIKPINIAQVVSRSTGIPATDLIKPEIKTILQLEKNLNRNIIGQEAAISDIKTYLKRAKAGLTSDNRPLASFLLIGPSGVGKTHTAKVLAKDFFGDAKSLVRIDMSEFGEKFNVSKLIGSPAGYVGYKESGQLTEKIKHQPHSLVLLDEIEKANKDIFDLLLQILDEGYLTDAAGNKIDFQNTIIVMTSNIGSGYYNNKEIGFNNPPNSDIEAKINKEIRSTFKPEFINRLDRIIYFQPLADHDLEKIAHKELNDLFNKIKEQKRITISYDKNLPGQIIESLKQTGNNRGARGINSLIRDQVENALAEIIINNGLKAKKTLLAKSKNGIIALS